MVAVAAIHNASSLRLSRAVGVATTAAVAVATTVLVPALQATAHATTAYALSATIGVGDESEGGSIAVDSSTHRAYVTSYHDNALRIINTSTNTGGLSTPVGVDPIGVAIDTIGTPAMPMVFVANYGGHSISFVDTSTNLVVGTVDLGGNDPVDMAVDTSTDTLYAVGDPANGAVNCCLLSVVDDFHRSLTSTVAFGGDVTHVAVDSSTHKVYATNGPNLWELDGTPTKVTSVTAGAGRVAVNPVTHTVYVTNQSNTAPVVSVVDESTNLVTATVPVGTDPGGVAVDTTANVIYVSNAIDNTVSVIDGTTNTVVATVPVGVTPAAIAVDSATHKAYVVDEGSNSVSVISSTGGSAARLSGSDRFGTAVAVSKTEFPTGGAGAVVLARGDDYPDALVGAPLAAANNAPLLLTTGSALPAGIKAEIQRVLAPGKTVFLLGGTNAVPASIASELTGLGYVVTRYSGADRFATAVKVADALGDPNQVLLATGTNFPDALTAGVAAVESAGVVLLTNGPTLPAETSAYLSAHPGTVYAIGGPAAAADPSAEAIVGADRFATGAAVATRFFSGPSQVGVATGLSFPDALSAGALLGHLAAPLLLVGTSSVPSSVTSYLATVKGTVTSGFVIGGPNTVNQSVADAISASL
jgi:YVTN family beta-propeller protein